MTQTEATIFGAILAAPSSWLASTPNALAAAGLRVSGANWRVRTISSGGAVYIYVNSKRRFANGLVTNEEVGGIISKVVGVLGGLRDPLTGRRVFQTIATWEELAAFESTSTLAQEMSTRLRLRRYRSLRSGRAADRYIDAESGHAEARQPVARRRTLPQTRKQQ